MNRIIASFCLVFSLLYSTSIFSQKIIDKNVLNRLDTLFNRDQESRKITLGEKKWNLFMSLPKLYQDSIWRTMNTTDSINFIEFFEILKTYGYISDAKRGKSTIMGILLLHNISEQKVKLLDSLLMGEVLKGKMPALDYATWYDRYLLQVRHVKFLYGEYFRRGKYPCVDDINITNTARKKIGLKPFNKSKCN